MRHGRPPKAPSLVMLEGNPGKRRVKAKELKPKPTWPEMPSYLDEGAKKEWLRLCPILEHMKVLTEADGIALGSLCQFTSRRAALELLLGDVVTQTSKSDMEHTSPVFSALILCADREERLSREFGLTPASRSRFVTDDSGKQQNGGLLNGQWRAKA